LALSRDQNSRRIRVDETGGFPALVELIYSTIDDPEDWTLVLEALGSYLGATSASIYHTHHVPPGQPSVRVVEGVKSLKGLGPLCFLNPALNAGHNDAVNAVALEDLLCPYERLLRTSFFQRIDSSSDTWHSLHATITADNDFQAQIVLFRSREQGRFLGRQAGSMEIVLPHLRRALNLRQRIVGLESSAGSSAQALDQVPQAILLLDETGRVLFTNHRAQSIHAQHDGISLDGANIRVSKRAEQETLAGLVREAASKSARGGAMRVSRRSHKRPFVLMVAPFRARVRSLDRPRSAAAIVFLNDPDENTPPPIEILGRLYGLTAAECRIAQSLALGGSLEEVARRFDVSLATVRTHLKRIFMKTNTRRQSELVRLLLGSVFELGSQERGSSNLGTR
jgi:DNA-binding CsgD family transcriptional regulator/PAS domain-containing protein